MRAQIVGDGAAEAALEVPGDKHNRRQADIDRCRIQLTALREHGPLPGGTRSETAVGDVQTQLIDQVASKMWIEPGFEFGEARLLIDQACKVSRIEIVLAAPEIEIRSSD